MMIIRAFRILIDECRRKKKINLMNVLRSAYEPDRAETRTVSLQCIDARLHDVRMTLEKRLGCNLVS